MNIAFGFDIFYPETNGVITTTINLARNLIENGHKVWFFVPKDKGFTEDRIENGINIVHVKAISSWIYKGIKLLPIYGNYLMPYLKKYRIDVVHNTSPWLMGTRQTSPGLKPDIHGLIAEETLTWAICEMCLPIVLNVSVGLSLSGSLNSP